MTEAFTSPTLLLACITMIFVSCYDPGPYEESKIDPSKEVASDISMIYSDSAVVKFRIISPLLEKYDDNGVLVEDFPKGLRIEFYDDNLEISSWVHAKYAQRRGADGTMLLKDSVVLENERDDRLETSALTWNELDQTLTTPKFIRMIQGSTQDTLYGTGFKANIDFSKFQVANFIGKRKYEDLNPDSGSNN